MKSAVILLDKQMTTSQTQKYILPPYVFKFISANFLTTFFLFLKVSLEEKTILQKLTQYKLKIFLVFDPGLY